MSDRLLLLLDGLDEYEGQKWDLIRFINDFHSAKVKICLASRGDPPFPDAFEGLPTLAMHKLNTPGIEAFAIHTLSDVFARSQNHNRQTFEKIAKDVAKNVNGGFFVGTFCHF